VYEPGLPAHERDLPAAAAAAPALAEMATMSDGEYANVHWMPAGSLPEGELSERFRDTVPPGAVAPDDSAKESDWQKAAAPDIKNAKNPLAYLSVREHIVAKYYASLFSSLNVVFS